VLGVSKQILRSWHRSGCGPTLIRVGKRIPELRGVVFDLASGSAEASRQLDAHNLSERCEVNAGDFFSSVPRNADAYILKNIIHNWDDERSVTILRNCREAIAADGKLLLMERVMPAQIDAEGNRQRWFAQANYCVACVEASGGSDENRGCVGLSANRAY
jgi:O-methyltransferase domain